MKNISLFFSILFIVFAIVQYNNPDPLFWVSLYLLPAIVCFLSYANRPNKMAYIALLIGYATAAIMLFPDRFEGIGEQMKADQPWIEEARESLGMGIVAIAMLFELLRKRTVIKNNENNHKTHA